MWEIPHLYHLLLPYNLILLRMSVGGEAYQDGIEHKDVHLITECQLLRFFILGVKVQFFWDLGFRAPLKIVIFS